VPLPEVAPPGLLLSAPSVPVATDDPRTPRGLRWVETCDGPSWRIAHTPNPGVRWVIVGFAVFWNFFAWQKDAPLWMRVVAAGLAYLGLAVLNRAAMAIDASTVRLRWGPFPQTGNFAVPTPAVSRFVTETQWLSGNRGPVPLTYVKMVTSDGAARKLFGFAAQTEAEFVAGRLNDIVAGLRVPVNG
jgi:hypothetical protein